tara:strand:- start:2116 stop:3144 length:1029 start_codon:yes stop_codon:yes gene_type:complete
MRESIWFDPPYQRFGDIWPLEKRQLLIDSILNGFDVPKLYFHEFFPAKEIDGKKFKYAIVDGKQRLQSIFAFIEGRFPIADRFELLEDLEIKPGNLTYAELAREYPTLKTRFDGFVLPIVSILTDDTELIEDMFSRLNEAVPLNAAEKRNSFGGPIPPIIRDMSQNAFFREKIPFTNARYRHFDLIAKFLYLQSKGQLVDTKKIHLDDFVRTQKNANDPAAIAAISQGTADVLDALTGIFVDRDNLLRSVGTVVLYFYLFHDAIKNGWVADITRKQLDDFEVLRCENRRIAEKGEDRPDYTLLEFDRLTQSPNDGVALRYRYTVLRKYIGPEEGRPELASED